MTYTELVKIVADGFEEDCREIDCTFSEMVRCYGKDSEDIKYDVECVVINTNEAWMDDDGITIWGDNSIEPYKYRKFIADVRKELKTRGL